MILALSRCLAAPAAVRRPRVCWRLSSKGRGWAAGASSSRGGGEGPDLALEDEVEDDDSEGPSPNDRESFSVSQETKSKDLDTLLQQIEKGDINLAPHYQRQYVWPYSKAAKLVESVFADMFIPAVVLHTGADGVHDVVDGKQRLITLYSFWKGRFPDGSPFKLQGLKHLEELNDRAWSSLPERSPFPSRRHFMNYTLTVTTFGEGTSCNAVLRVYEDLNCGSEALNKQQVRRAVYGGPYIDLLGELAKNETFQKLLGAKGIDVSEKDQELILRFFALWRAAHKSVSPLKVSRGSMDKFLSSELAANRNLDGESQAEMKELFEATVELAHSVYGGVAFRRWNGAAYSKISLGLFDSVMLTMGTIAAQQNSVLAKRIVQDMIRERLREDLKKLCVDPEFASLLKCFSWPRLASRLEVYSNRVYEIVGDSSRFFPNPGQLKQQLLEAQEHTCAICSKPVTLERAELDHRIPWSLGGSSDRSNAQLVHSWCNRSKGASMP